MEERNMSKICSACGAELSDDATFCGQCGKPVSLFTPPPVSETPTSSGDMPAAENFAANAQQPIPQQQQPYGGQQSYGQQGGYQQQPQGGYGQPQYQQNMNAYNQSMNAYNQSQYMGLNDNTFSPYSQGEQPVSVGQWMITSILLAIPIVGIIYFIILAIGGPNTKKSLTNYARAALLWALISFVLVIILTLAFGLSFNEILKEAQK